MENNLSSADALELLGRLQREHSIVDVTYAFRLDATTFSLRGATISKLSEQEIEISNEKGDLVIPLEGFSFKVGTVTLLVFEAPPGATAPSIKSCLHMRTEQILVWIMEIGQIQQGPSLII